MGDMVRCLKCSTFHYRNDPCVDTEPRNHIHRPRIWTEWDCRFYESGTTIVCCRDVSRPHLYVYADAGIDEDRYVRDRYAMCYQLRDYMNGSDQRPEWLDDFERVNETALRSLAGGMIDAVGPVYDADPPKLDWRQDDSDEAKDNRARLIDALTFQLTRG